MSAERAFFNAQRYIDRSCHLESKKNLERRGRLGVGVLRKLFFPPLPLPLVHFKPDNLSLGINF